MAKLFYFFFLVVMLENVWQLLDSYYIKRKVVFRVKKIRLNVFQASNKNIFIPFFVSTYLSFWLIKKKMWKDIQHLCLTVQYTEIFICSFQNLSLNNFTITNNFHSSVPTVSAQIKTIVLLLAFYVLSDHWIGENCRFICDEGIIFAIVMLYN